MRQLILGCARESCFFSLLPSTIGWCDQSQLTIEYSNQIIEVSAAIVIVTLRSELVRGTLVSFDIGSSLRQQSSQDRSRCLLMIAMLRWCLGLESSQFETGQYAGAERLFRKYLEELAGLVTVFQTDRRTCRNFFIFCVMAHEIPSQPRLLIVVKRRCGISNNEECTMKILALQTTTRGK